MSVAKELIQVARRELNDASSILAAEGNDAHLICQSRSAKEEISVDDVDAIINAAGPTKAMFRLKNALKALS